MFELRSTQSGTRNAQIAQKSSPGKVKSMSKPLGGPGQKLDEVGPLCQVV